MVSRTATSCAGRATGPGGTQANETMKCPICQSPMEGGYIEDHTWFAILPRERKFDRAFAKVSEWFSKRESHSIIAHRCPDCARIELSAP